MKTQLHSYSFFDFKKAFFFLTVFLLISTKSYSQCTFPTNAPKVGDDITLCVDNSPTTTSSVNAGQYVVVNVVQGFNYTFSVSSVFFGLKENLTLFRFTNNEVLSYNSSLSGTSITWTSTFSGQVKLLLSKGNCLNDGSAGGPLTLAINSVGNTLDSQTTFGTDKWIGHVYNWSGSNPPGGTSAPASPSATSPFITDNYVGYYIIGTETIAETFGGDKVCFPVLSANVNRTNIYTETFAVRYRMRSTKTGYYMMNVSADDGVRVFVDGNLVLNQWKDQGVTEYCNTLIYLKGNSDIILDYYENGGGNVVNFSLTPLNTATNTIAGLDVRAVCAPNSVGLLDGSTYTNCGGVANSGVAFQWQISTDNVNFSNILNATGEDYTPPSYTVNTTNYYRRLVKSNGSNSAIGAIPSNVITVNTNASVGGTVSAPQTICSGTAPAALTLTGHTGNVIRWEKASNIGFTGLTTIVSTVTTLPSSTIGNLTANTYFRAMVQNGTCPEAYSTPVLITIGGALANNTLSYTNGTSGQISATAVEHSTTNGSAVLNSPTGTYFSTINFASYGLPGGTAPNFTYGACHSATSQSVTEGYVLGNSTATIPASNGPFGDPCSGETKRLYVLASYVQPICSGTSVTLAGSLPTGGTGSFVYLWQSSASRDSGFVAAAGSNNGQNYTTGNLTQTTYFRRVVTSCSNTITSAVVMVKVNATPTITTAATATSICTSATAQTTLLSYSATTGLPTTYSITWNNTPTNTFAAVSNVVLAASSISITVPANTAAGTYTGTITVKNASGCVSVAKTFTLTVNPQNTVALTSAAGTDNQTLCINTSLTSIIYTTTGAAGIGTPSGLPSGVTAAWASNKITISGTPTVSGTSSYTIPLSGGCGATSVKGTIKVTPLAVTPGAPSALNLSLIGAVVTGTFTAPSTVPSGYVIARSTSATMPLPVAGTAYNTGSTVDGNYIVRGTDTPSTATTFTDTLPTNGVNYYYVFSFNTGCGTVPLYSTGITANIKYVCSPGSTSVDRYISNVQFVGTLSPDTDNVTTYSAGGYGDFKSKAEKGKQIPGGAININFSAVGPAGSYSNAKAWVDWNKDGIFETGEIVYDSKGTGIKDLIFGYVVPATLAPGFYTLRLKIFDSANFDACGTMVNGETEDYSFEVIADCMAKIQSVTVSQRCGAGPVTLTATGTTNTLSYLWYKEEFGTPIPGKNSNTFTTEALAVGTHTYYVRAVGSCTSVYYRPVKVTVSPTPIIEFTQTSPDICGYESSIKVVSSGDKQEITLLSDNFNTFNNFENVVENTPAGALESDWQPRPSPYVFTNILTPAVSSGYEGGNYAAIVTDNTRNSNLLNHLTIKNSLSSVGFLNLNFDFDLYYFSEVDNDVNRGYVKVQYSLDNGGSWADIPSKGTSKALFTEDHGIPTKWDKISIILPDECLGKPQLKFRISMFAYGSAVEYMANLAAVDNIRIYGDKPLETAFSWAGTGLSVFKANCTDPYDNTPTNEICIKPTRQQIEDNANFTLTAKANLNNGCSAEGSLTILNSSKTWSNPSEVNNWQTATAWKPVGSPGLPSSDKCVIIKSPVEVGATAQGFAKNILIEAGGSLKIEGNLTVTDFVKNENAAADNFTLKSDGNLLQLNESKTINVGLMKAERKVTGIKYNPVAGPAQAIDYVYWSSPVVGQQTKGPGGFSPGTPASRFYYYQESNDRFYETGDLTFRPGRGYAVRAEEGLGISYEKTYEFRGTPNNGEINFGITRTPNNPVVRGYNMVGNPYPSNIDFDELYLANSALIYHTAWFWTNSTFTYQQMGQSYEGNNYAVYNGAGGNAATYNPASPYTGNLKPNGVIKVGQGFLIQKRNVGTENLIFKNSYESGHNLRIANPGIFFTKGGTPKNRFWLKLSSPNGLVNTQLIGYFPAATDDYEQDYDAEIMSMSSDLFYSKLADKQLLIQGKGNFVIEDKVILGANFYKNSSYTISLETPEGIFASGQRIYLKDKNTGTLTNLSETAYTFDTAAGISEGRFEIVYKPEQVLATGGTDKDSLVIYKDGNNFVVKAQSKKITTLELYDSSGRLIYSLQPNNTKAVISAETLNEGVYVLKINQDNVQTLRKVLK